MSRGLLIAFALLSLFRRNFTFPVVAEWSGNDEQLNSCADVSACDKRGNGFGTWPTSLGDGFGLSGTTDAARGIDGLLLVRDTASFSTVPARRVRCSAWLLASVICLRQSLLGSSIQNVL